MKPDDDKTPYWAERAREKDLLVLRAAKECPDWLAKFESRFAESSGVHGCQEWLRGTDDDGYGMASIPLSVKRLRGSSGSAHVRTHRARFVIAAGRPIEFGLVLDHVVCSNRLCGSVEHMVETTHELNVRRVIAPRKRSAPWGATECPSGFHSLVDILSRAHRTTGRQPVCVECQRIWKRVVASYVNTARLHHGMTLTGYRASVGLSLRAALRAVGWDRDLLVINLARDVDLWDLVIASCGSGDIARLAGEAAQIAALHVPALCPDFAMRAAS